MIVKVHLAEVPTDVLLHLYEYAGKDLAHFDIVSAVAPDTSRQSAALVAGGLVLLREAGYVIKSSTETWTISSAGLRAVDEALARTTATTAEQPVSAAEEDGRS